MRNQSYRWVVLALPCIGIYSFHGDSEARTRMAFFTNGSGTSTWKKRESHKPAPNGRFIIHQHLHSATFSPCARHITQHLPSLANTSLLDCGGRNSPLPIGNSVCQTNSQTKHIYYTEPPPPQKKNLRCYFYLIWVGIEQILLNSFHFVIWQNIWQYVKND